MENNLTQLLSASGLSWSDVCLLLCSILQKRKIESNWKFQQKVVVLIRSLENVNCKTERSE